MPVVGCLRHEDIDDRTPSQASPFVFPLWRPVIHKHLSPSRRSEVARQLSVRASPVTSQRLCQNSMSCLTHRPIPDLLLHLSRDRTSASCMSFDLVPLFFLIPSFRVQESLTRAPLHHRPHNTVTKQGAPRFLKMTL